MPPLAGRVHGHTIDLDSAPSPPFEGKRVLAALQLVEEEKLSPDEQQRAWSAWLTSGAQGPIEDEREPELP